MTQANLEKTRDDVIVEVKPSGVAFVTFDSPSKENFLTRDLTDRLQQVALRLRDDETVKGVVILSNKEESFISGADLHEIIKFEDKESALELCRRGHELFNILDGLPKPTIAGIHGRCLGGGLELALCCDRRIATNSPNTQLGLPEVKLGLLPGLGGTQRLPRLIELRSAVELILSGESVDWARAFELGIVDEVVDRCDLVDHVEKLCLSLIEEQRRGNTIKPARQPAPMPDEKQASFFRMMERSLRIRTRGKYPAPPKVLEVIQKGLKEGIEAGLKAETEAFADLSVTDVSRNLILLFFTTEFVKQSAASQASRRGAEPIKSVGIIGSGLMGTTIAHAAALSGFHVFIRSANKERQEQAEERLRQMIERSEAKAGKQADEIKETLSRVRSVTDDSMLGDADLVVEACVENIDGKTVMLSGIAPHLKPSAIIATNTSSLSVEQLSERVNSPTDFVGVHFFHPVEKMPLVEVIPSKRLKRENQARVMSFLSRLGKIPLAVKDSTCFLVNRLLCCYIVEGARLVQSGVPVNWIEEAAIDFGMPMGPWCVTDEVGYDVARLVSNAVHKSFGERFVPPPVMDGLERIGIIGKKTGTGIYLYDEHGKNLGFNNEIIEKLNVKSSDEKLTAEKSIEIAERIILPMVDESARCLDERVIRRPRELDLATVLGIGFPPFRGGLLRYADSLGIDYVIDRLNQFYSGMETPKRSVSDYLLTMQREGRTFYSRSKDSDEA